MIQHITELKKSEKGARAVITLLTDLEGDGIAGDRTLEGNEEAMKSFDQVIRLDQLRHANRHEGRMADQKSVVSFREESRDKLAYWLSDRIDQLAFLTLAGIDYSKRNSGGVRVGSDLPYLEFNADVTPPSAKRYARWDGATNKVLSWGTGSSSVTTSDTPTWGMFVQAKAYAKDNYLRGIKSKGGEEVKKVIEWINTKTNLRTRENKLIPKSVIYVMLRNKFYTGYFVMKGIEYQGAYEPIVSPELFGQVQTKLRPFRNTHPRGDKYSIARFMRCSLCGSPVHRQVKIRKLRSGQARLHIYYRCSLQKNRDCKAAYVSEENVFRDISRLIEQADVSGLDFPEQIQDEIIRFERMRWNILAKMSGSSIKLSIYPMKFREVDETTVKMYLQNMILYAKADKRYYLISLLLTNLGQLKIDTHGLSKYFTSSLRFFPST
jgi:hypothetical protein